MVRFSFNRHCGVMSVWFKLGQPCDLPVNGSSSLYGKYREVQCNASIIDTDVPWIILIKNSSNLDWLEFGLILAKFRDTWPYPPLSTVNSGFI